MFLQLIGVPISAIFFSLPLAWYHILHKIQVEQVEALILATYWPIQPWFTQILSLAAQEPLVYKLNATN